MRREIATIFNNVMGPVTAGPSTSNTCGPGRIAYLSRCALGGYPKSAHIIFPENSTYPSTYQGMKTDYAFANGILGRMPDHPDFLNAFYRLKEQDISIDFEISNAVHAVMPLTSYIQLTSEGGETVETVGVSKGGGIIELIRVDGFPVSISGDRNVLLLFLDSAAAINMGSLVEERLNCRCDAVAKDGRALLVCSLKQVTDIPSIITTVEQMSHVERVRYLPAILPVVVQEDAQPPFITAKELLDYCHREDKDLWEAAVDYESVVSGWSGEKVMEAMGHILEVARRSVEEGLRPGLKYPGILPARAAKMQECLQTRSKRPCSLMSKAAIYSTAIMEYSNASGLVVCIPTAGASGVVSGLLLAAGDVLSLSNEELVKAYLCAGAVGVVCTEENDFCGAQYGCQAEVGFASAFAAAGYAYLLGCDAEQMLAAASMALQNMLGLVCDPVCGFVQIPCYARNIAGISNAIASADAVSLGFDPRIPLDESFVVLKKIGGMLPRELRGCGGGLCWCPTARAMADTLNHPRV